ncbi:MAG: ATP-binding protein [Clostridia bacterium]|nr:ATP-binding protein [Clostridia bacterium]
MSEITRKIMSDYEDLRLRRISERNLRIEKVYATVPEIREIDKSISIEGANNVRRILSEPQNADKYNREYKKFVAEKRKEKNAILKEHKISIHFDEIKYDCKDCKDTGFLEDGKKCSCFRQKIIEERYKKSNLYDSIKDENFDNFSFDYYSKQKINGDMSPYDYIKRVYKRAVIFCDRFDTDQKSLLFYGDSGLGKTFLSTCIAKKLMDMGKTVLYLRAQQLFLAYEDYRFMRDSENSDLSDIYNADLLIIDDLGTEQQNKNNFAFFFDLLNERLEKGKKVLINTNYTMDKLEDMYTQRFTSRIYEHFLIYGFYGEDIRIQKLKS